MTARSATMSALVRDLALVTQGDEAHVGAKAATLGELAGAGLPVPDGFVVDAAAYEQFVSTTRIDRHIAERLAGLDVTDEGARRQAAADISVGMVATPLPREMHDAILAAYVALSGAGPPTPVAVRSSAATPNTDARMLAHANDTFLCIRSGRALLDAVRRCWSSLHSARALLLRAELGMDSLAELDVGVLVQRQVFSTRAGIVLTGPIDSARDGHVAIAASYGLGEGPATGQVEGDRYLVDRRSLEVLARETSHKKAVVREAPGADGGTRRQPLAGTRIWTPALLDEEAQTVAKLGLQVEDRLGAPQVVEWAIDRAGKAWVLQATPLSVAAMAQTNSATTAK